MKSPTFLLALGLWCTTLAAADAPKAAPADATAVGAASSGDPQPAGATVSAPERFADLRRAIEREMKHSGVPAAGVVVVDADGSTWATGLGTANVEKGTAADADTQFRIGSTSKIFAALSILQLQEEGRVHLTDRVHDLVPDVQFTNPWEATNPVLVAHLLEHTTGWDDIHLVEYASNDPKPLTLLEGLALHPHSRVSRWVPGTRMAYCNAGPAVAAAIVERITGQRFEDYVREHFFVPLGLEHATYFADAYQAQHGAALYVKREPQPYWNISIRPAGAINASPNDMLRLLQFFLHRGRVDGHAIISEASLHRMETPTTTPADAAGLETGYGLANYTTIHHGYLYHGHNGGVMGGLTELAYCPELGVGHVLMINDGDGGALYRILKIITDFETRDQPARHWAPPKTAPVIKPDPAVAGYYREIAPRTQMVAWLTAIVGARHYSIRNGRLHRENFLSRQTADFVPVSPTRFRSTESGLVAVALVADPLAGPVLVEDTFVGQRQPTALFFAPLVLLGGWVVAMTGGVIFAIVWGIRLVSGSLKNGPTIRVRMWPLLATAAAGLAVVFILVGAARMFARLGHPTISSVGIMASTAVFALLAAWSVVTVVRERAAPMNRWNYWFAVLLSALHLLAALFFLVHGLIGLRTWA